MFYNMDCVAGAKKYLKDASVDLIVTDPPFGIEADKFHRQYNRNSKYVIPGYIEVPKEKYYDFSCRWIAEAERVLKPGGSLYIFSGYTNLRHILNALAETQLLEVNHIIWKFNFGMYTKSKFVSSHFHLLYFIKPGAKPTFNTFCRYTHLDRDVQGSLNYRDREDVWVIPREIKRGRMKNAAELPSQLIKKIIQYSSNKGDLVCDFFLGGFTTAKVAIGLNRQVCGFEKNPVAFSYQLHKTGYS